MRSRYRIREAEGTYFVTSTIVEWLPIFTTAACCDILVNSLLHCREHKSLRIHAWSSWKTISTLSSPVPTL